MSWSAKRIFGTVKFKIALWYAALFAVSWAVCLLIAYVMMRHGLLLSVDQRLAAGTSLAVYPAASLVRYVRPEIPVYLVDPGNPDTAWIRNPLTHIRERSAVGMPRLVERLRAEEAERLAGA